MFASSSTRAAKSSLRPNNRNKRLIARDTRCWLCGQRVLRYGGKSNPARPSTDHVLERRNGGPDEMENYRLAHAWCNSIRKDYPNPRLHPEYDDVIKLRLKKAKKWDEPLHRR